MRDSPCEMHISPVQPRGDLRFRTTGAVPDEHHCLLFAATDDWVVLKASNTQ